MPRPRRRRRSHALSATFAVTVALAVAVAGPVAGAATGGIASVPTAPTPAPGTSGSGDSYYPAMGNGGYNVRSYDIDLRWKPVGRHVRAAATVTSVATQGLSSFTLELVGLNVRSVLVDGARASYQRERAQMRVVPASRVAKGSTFTTVVKYDGRPRVVRGKDHARTGWIPTSDGATVLAEPIGAMTWFPVNNTPRDKATYDISVNVPNHLKAASNGRLLRRDVAGHRTTWHWRETNPMAAYLATVSIGKYRMFGSTTRTGLSLSSFVDPARGRATRARRALPKVIAFLERTYGAYPFDSAGLIVDDVGVDYALETQGRPVYPQAPPDWLMVHEMAHQWFGNSVTLTDWRDIWLNEGFASYAEWLWAAEVAGRPGIPQRIFDVRYDSYGAGSAFWKVPPGDPGAARMFALPVYERGAMALQALRMTVGSATFFEILRTWAREHSHGSGTTAGFVVLAERVSGQQLDQLFEAWLYRATKPPGY